MSNGPTFNVRIQLNAQDRVNANLGLAQFMLDQQVIKDSNYFVPEDTGTLKGSALISSDVGKGRVVWNTPYARKLYYNPQYNFSKDKNPNARGLWFEESKKIHKQQWLKMAQDILRSGRA